VQVHLRNEFVLKPNGEALCANFSESDYLSCFQMQNVFHGLLDDNIMMCLIRCVASNKPLLARLVPRDNAYRQNVNMGAYHFRFWKMGDWYDVVVDDYLPVDAAHNRPLFACNVTHLNEFWPALFEKAFCKYYIIFKPEKFRHNRYH
jgi:hypothetical protein